MSTRCQILSIGYDGPGTFHTAIVYRHSDGYPDTESGVLHDLLPVLKKFKKYRGFDPDYLTAHIVAEFIRLQHEQTKLWIRKDRATAKAEGREFTKKDAESIRKYAYLGHGVEGFDGEFHSDLAYIYIIQKDHVEVRITNDRFDDDPVLKNTDIELKVDFNGKKYGE